MALLPIIYPIQFLDILDFKNYIKDVLGEKAAIMYCQGP